MSTARHHAEWLSLVEVSGPFLSLPVLLRAFPQGLDAHDPQVSRSVRLAHEEWADNQQGLRPDPAIHTAWVRFVLRDVLEFPDDSITAGPAIPETIKASIAEHGETLRPDLLIQRAGHPPRMLVQVVPPAQDLEKPLKDRRWKASPATRMVELLRATSVRLGLITNGEHWMLVHAQSGETAGFSSWYASLWLEEQVTLRAFRSLLGAYRLFGVADPDTLEALLTESAANQQEVTTQLGYQVRQAVHVLVETIDRIDKDGGRRLLAGVPETMLYESALTVMMRLVFLFSAEERGLLLLGKPIYDQHYAVSTLRAQLREAADQVGEEVLERRHDAWSRLLAIFRAVFGGVQHEDLRLPAYGGALFDPDRFPFLEGRAPDTRWTETPAHPIPVDNRTVLHLLEALQILRVKVPGGPAEPRRLSFRALDIEQIGHVYEGLLDHTARRTNEPVLGLTRTKDREPELPLARLEQLAGRQRRSDISAAQQSLFADETHPIAPTAELLAFLREETGQSENALRNALATQTTGRDLDALRAACDNDAALVARVLPFAGLLRRDTFNRPMVITAGSVYVTSGTDRRSTGTHYTPRSLTEPIVQHTLDPLVYHGPAEGLPRDQWRLHSADRILSLQVCDMAMGSGAFLVQACRYLSERLVEAWEVCKAQGSGIGERLAGANDNGDGNSPISRTHRVAAEHAPGRDHLSADTNLSAGRTIRPDESDPPTQQAGYTPIPDPRSLPPNPLPADPDERLALARRLVADRCLYGVDKNPLAVEMAKLSLWLITLQKDRPFSFLDHALRGGDSLLGIDSVDQLLHWSLEHNAAPTTATFLTRPLQQALQHAIALRRRIRETPVRDVRDADRKAAWLREAEDTMELVRLAADLLVAAQLHKDKKRRAELSSEFQYRMSLAADAWATTRRDRTLRPDANRDELAALRREADDLLEGRTPFHWPLEFPEVFVEEARPEAPGTQFILDGFSETIAPLFAELEQQIQSGPGFAAIVGNPPFQGGKKITGAIGVPYRDYLVEYLANGQRGHADLCAYFFLRGGELMEQRGQLGLIATNTIAQGDTREVGLDQLIAQGFTIPRAVPSRPWPGTAALEVAHIWLRRGTWQGGYTLNDQPTNGITPFLTAPGAASGNPYRLKANENKSFIGSYVLGMGFVLEPAEAAALIEKDPRNRDVLFPYLNGEDLNSRPDQSPSRWVINFHDWQLERAETYPDAMRIIREKVKPERTRINEAGEFVLRKPLPQKWWIYGDKRPALYATIAGMERVLAVARVSKYVVANWKSSTFVFSEQLVIVSAYMDSFLSVIQSSIHDLWVWKNSSTLGAGLRYAPTDCFETFPFPWKEHSDSRSPIPDPLDTIGERYHDHRKAIMADRNEGLTKTYNRFHNPAEASDDIAELRRLHVDMDNAVAAAYGWNDLDLGHGFHDTRQGLRYTISEAARRTVLDRLLELNHQRYAEEVAAGLHDKKGSGAGGRGSGKGGRKGKAGTPAQQPGSEQGTLL